jgi:type IV secretion system protein VirD4
MKDRADRVPTMQKRLLGTAAIVAGVAALSGAATQFIAWRVHYHPALGTPWFHHVYAPWSWITWTRAPWASNAKATFGLVDAGLMGVVSLGLVAGLIGASSRRRKPVKHEGVHGTARFMSEQEMKPACSSPASNQKRRPIWAAWDISAFRFAPLYS